MLKYLCSISNTAIAVFLFRWALGLKFALVGIQKVFVITIPAFANHSFVERFADSWIPEPLLWLLGYTFPPVELAAGVLLCIGWRRREALAALGGLLVIALFGHILQETFFNVATHAHMWLLAVIAFLLIVGEKDDAFTVDGWLAEKKAG